MNITIIMLLRSFGTGPKRLVKRSTKYNVYQKRLRVSSLACPVCKRKSQTRNLLLRSKSNSNHIHVYNRREEEDKKRTDSSSSTRRQEVEKLKGNRLFQGCFFLFCFVFIIIIIIFFWKRKSTRPLRIWRINTCECCAEEALGQKERKLIIFSFLSASLCLSHLSLLIPLSDSAAFFRVDL